MKIAIRTAIVALLLGALISSSAFPITKEQSDACRQAERIGRAIYEQDAVSSKATDALAAKVDLSSLKGPQGWITVQNGADRWLVRFVGEREGILVAFYDISAGSDGTYSVAQLEPPSRLSDSEAGVFRARQSAIAAMSDRCESQYNTIVLPRAAGDGDGWLVYLLAATDKDDEIVVGGHFRADVTPDGKLVRQMDRITNSCLRMNVKDAKATGGGTQGLFVTHHASPTPNEAHVVLSLLHRIPISVGTEVGIWVVSEGNIQFASEWPKDTPSPQGPNSDVP